jgi:hypothetical protein
MPAPGGGTSTAATESAQPLPVEPRRLDLRLVGQQENMWCWATTTQMIMEYLRRGRIEPDRCEQATVSANRKRAELELCCQEDLSSGRKEFCGQALPECKRVDSIPRQVIDCCSRETSDRVRADYCNEDLRQCAQARVRADDRREKKAGRSATISLSPGLAYRYQGVIQPVDIDSASYARRTAPIDCCNPATVESYEGYWDCNQGGFPDFEEHGYTAKSTKCPCRLYLFAALVNLGDAETQKLDELLADPSFKGAAASTDSTSGCLKMLVSSDVVSQEQLDAWMDDEELNLRSQLSSQEDCALSWQTLTAEIDAGRPVAFSWRYQQPGAGHMPVAAGYAVTPPSQKWVLVFDPLPPGNGDWYLVPYAYYVAGPDGRHWRDYFGIELGTEPTVTAAAPPASSLQAAPGMDIHRPPMMPLSPPISLPDGTQGTCVLDANDVATARETALTGVQAVEALVHGSPDFGSGVGFGLYASDTPEELSLAADPLPVCELTLADLKSWRRADGVQSLLHRPNELLWPVVHREEDEEKVFTALILRRSGGRWRLAKIGSRAAVELQYAEAPERSFVLSVPALYQKFIGTSDRLTPIYPTDFFPPNSQVNAGSYDDVLLELRQVAHGFSATLGDAPEP